MKWSKLGQKTDFWAHFVSHFVRQNFEIWFKWNALKGYGFGPFCGPIYCQETKHFAKKTKFLQKLQKAYNSL